MTDEQKAPKEIRLIINPTDAIAYAEQQLTEWRKQLAQAKIDIEKRKQYIKGYAEGSKDSVLVSTFTEPFLILNDRLYQSFSQTCLALDLSIDMVKLTTEKTMRLYEIIERMLNLPHGTDNNTLYERAKEYGKILKYLREKIDEEEEMRRLAKK